MMCGSSLEMYRRMVRIREFELAAMNLFKRGQVKGAIHPYIGQEASGVGVCMALRKDDLIAGTHRSHGHNIAKGAEPTKAELVSALEASGEALGRLFEQIDEAGEVKAWSGSPPSTFLAYHVAHEAHHRALASVALRTGGHKLPSEVTLNQWYTWRKSSR